MTSIKPSHLLTGVLIAIAALVAFAGPASAHLDLVKTNPSDGAAKTSPVAEVSLTFSVPGKPAGEGIVILGHSGTQVPAKVATPDDGITWLVTPSEPLPDGRYGVTWSVAAPDAHPKTGFLRFEVDLPAGASDPDTNADQGATETAPTETNDDALDRLLADPDNGLAETIRWFGATLALAGAVLGIGGLAFLGFVMAGRRSEVAVINQRVRWSGAVLVIGTLIQISAQSAVLQGSDWAKALTPESMSELVTGSFGWSIGLRLLGGFLITLGVIAAFSPAPKAALAATHPELDDPLVKASLRRSRVAIAGGGLYLASFLFDGHTATGTPLLLVWASDVVHVLAAAAWAGGIAMLATVLWCRKRANHRLDAAYLAVKFSVVAGASLVVAGIAGIALTVEILDEPSQLWASTWGQILIAKVALVAVVAAIGAYNHYRLIPLLEQAVDLRTNHPHHTDDLQRTISSATESTAVAVAGATRHQVETTGDRISRKLWFTTYAEILVLLGVIGLTAWLVSSSANL